MRYLELCSIDYAKKIVCDFLKDIENSKNDNINNNNINNNNINNNKNKKIDINNEIEEVNLFNCVNRTLAEDIFSNVDVPPFDRSKMDGYAVLAEDTYEAEEDNPITLKVIDKIKAGSYSTKEIINGQCIEIATGAPIPKGANAVVMVEYTQYDQKSNNVKIYNPVAPYENIQYCGNDIMVGELILRKNTLLTSREIGALASIGKYNVKVYKNNSKNKNNDNINNDNINNNNNNTNTINIGLISTGNELIPPNNKLTSYKIYDVNTYTLASSIIEKGWNYNFYGIVKDNREEMKNILKKALNENNDIIILSGGTSAGVGDLTSSIIEELGGEILVHGIKIKPGKPTIIGKINNKLIIGLPGYPTSCLTIFNVLLNENTNNKIEGIFSTRYLSSKGRTEYLPVNVVKDNNNNYKIYPITKGSGAITSLTYSDGYIIINENKEILENEKTTVYLYGNIKFGINIIGSHCIGIDNILREGNILAKTINVGSLGGLIAIKKGECDIAGIHLLAPNGQYNIPFIEKYNIKNVVLVRGYIRKQGFMFKKELGINNLDDLINNLSNYKFINRNKGSGTRLLFDKFLEDNNIDKSKINGYNIECNTHSAVGASVVMGKSQIGVGIETIAKTYNLEFIPIGDEYYDFLILKDKINNKDIKKFIKTLKTVNIPFKKLNSTGEIIYEN